MKIGWVRGAAIFAMLVAAVLGCGCGGSEPVLPDVVIVTLDTLRADHVGGYGGLAETPTLDRLAAQGTLFERAFCNVPLTLPSHATMLTGLLPP